MENNLQVEILVPKKENQSDAFFYANDGSIAEIKYGIYTFYAWACGDIDITDKKTGDRYGTRSGDVSDLYHLTDDQISDGDKFEWTNNNWFEISVIKKEPNEEKGEFIDLSEIAESYESAISAVKDIAEDRIKEWGI